MSSKKAATVNSNAATSGVSSRKAPGNFLHPSQNRVRSWPLSEETAESSIKQIKISQDGRYLVILLTTGVVQVYNTGKGTVHSLWSAGHRVTCIALWCPPRGSSIQESLTELSQLGSFGVSSSDASDAAANAQSDAANGCLDEDEELDAGKEQWISQLHSAHVCLLAAGTENGQLLVWNLDSKAENGSRASRGSNGVSGRSSGNSHPGWRHRCHVRSVLKNHRHKVAANVEDCRPNLFRTARDTLRTAIVSPIGSLAGGSKMETVITIKEEPGAPNGDVSVASADVSADVSGPAARSFAGGDPAETQRFWQGAKPRVFVNPTGLVSNVTGFILQASNPLTMAPIGCLETL